MNTMLKLSLRNIKENKKWAVMTISGIAISLMLVTMIVSFAAGGYDSLRTQILDNEATWNEKVVIDVNSQNPDSSVLELFKNRDGIERIWVESHFNMYTVERDDDTGDVYFTLTEYQKDYDLSGQTLSYDVPDLNSGRLADKPGEVALSRGQFNEVALGDKIKLQNSEGVEEEFVVVGLLNNYVNQVSGYRRENVATVSIEYKEGVVLKDELKLNKQIPKYSYSNYNTLVNSLRGLSFPTNRILWSAIILCGLIIAIISLSSISLIYNAFYLSLEQKVQQIGVLKSVGATNKQISLMVYFEGILLTLISITIGLFGGFILAKQSLAYVGMTFSNIANQLYIFEPKLNLFTIVAIYIVGILTVILPIRKSVKYANQVSPVDIIRNVSKSDEKIKYKKSPQWLVKLFGTSGSLAYKNYDRDRKKHRSTAISLIVVIILFISISSFVETGKSLISVYDVDNFDISFSNYRANGDGGLAFKDISERIEKKYDNVIRYTKLYLEENGDSKGFPLKPKYKEIQEKGAYVQQIAFLLEDDDFIKYYGEENLLKNIVYPRIVGTIYYQDGKSIKVNDVVHDIKAGETYEYAYWDLEGDFSNYNLTLDVIGSELPKGLMLSGDKEAVSYVMSRSQYNNLGLNKYYDSGESFATDTVLIKAQNHEEVEKEILEMLEEEQYSEFNYLKYFLYNQTKNTLLLSSIMGSVDIGVIIVTVFIIIICISNLLNVLASTSRQRLKEYGIYRSVGMNIKDLRKMLVIESIINSIKPLVIGSVLGVGITIIMFKIAESSMYLEAYSINMSAIAYALLMVLLVQFIQLISSMQLLKKSNIVQDLKRMEM